MHPQFQYIIMSSFLFCALCVCLSELGFYDFTVTFRMLSTLLYSFDIIICGFENSNQFTDASYFLNESS